MNKVQQAAMAWEAEAIQKCMNDPSIAAAGLCPVCMVHHPCLCEMDQTIREMRKYYEANRRTLFRGEPSAEGSWGIKIDVLMEELYRIATKKYAELLRSKE